MQTKAGAAKAAATMKAKYGEDFFKTIGSKGGEKQVPKGFAVMDKEKHLAASFKGGTISRRKKKA